MANNLKIQKESTNKFWHYHNGSVIARFFISDFDISLDGDSFVIVQKDGATRYRYKVADITIQDLTGSSALETFVSPAVFLARLMAINYTPFYQLTISGIPEAPLDGLTYGRRNATWVVVTPGAAGFSKTVIWDGTDIGVPSGYAGSVFNLSRTAFAGYSLAGSNLTVDPADADTNDVLILTSN